MNPPAQEIYDLIYQLIRSLENSDRSTCACYGVTPLQTLVLFDIAQKQPLGMQQLSQKMQLAVSTISRVVDKLVERGLISRQEDKNDRRAVLCSLTTNGQRVTQQLRDCYNGFFDQLVNNISPADLNGFLRGLRIMVQQLQKTDGCGCAVNEK
jgi:MarR family 2-MHQ and catechol resistance regulon transcriptional repressor